jgi:YidC/Oxa1 family membrane protein insertase
MEKKTILAIVLSVAVIAIYYIIMAAFFPSKKEAIVQTRTAPIEQTSSGQASVEPTSIGQVSIAIPSDEDAAEEFVHISTELIDATFSSIGGDIVSFKLKEHKDGSEYVDMILAGNKEAHALSLDFGGPLRSAFSINKISDTIVEFYRDLEAGGKPFRLSKKYTFIPDEYMFELSITIDGHGAIPMLGAKAYTLSFGPQIGPSFKALDEREDYRHYLTYEGGKVKTKKVSINDSKVIRESIKWAAIVGKYFALIALPDATQYEYTFSMQPPEPGVISALRLFIERPALSASVQKDVFRFYLGPKTSKSLDIYDNGDNKFHYYGEGLSEVANASGFLSILNPLETGLKWLLSLFYHLIPNYGVAIILVTLIVKLILFPLTKKSSEGTLRMQAIAPKIKEVQEKYKDNPTKMQTEMAGLYKKEGYNPLSGCLPMLIQIPIFLAMYNLFNNHFDLRGAMFIKDWIPDLSQPEYIYSFAPFKIPLLGWSEIRVLPFVYVGSQLLYGKVTQTPDQMANGQMKMMLYVLPIVFFFVLYNVPSGLLVYWIMSNILTMVQQLIINSFLAKKKADMKSKEEPVKKVIVPPKKRKRR